MGPILRPTPLRAGGSAGPSFNRSGVAPPGMKTHGESEFSQLLGSILDTYYIYI